MAPEIDGGINFNLFFNFSQLNAEFSMADEIKLPTRKKITPVLLFKISYKYSALFNFSTAEHPPKPRQQQLPQQQAFNHCILQQRRRTKTSNTTAQDYHLHRTLKSSQRKTVQQRTLANVFTIHHTSKANRRYGHPC
jgi:hypothetical protein